MIGAPLIVDEVYQTTVKGVAEGQSFNNVLYHQCTAVGGATDGVGDFANAINGSWQATIMPLLNAVYNLKSVVVKECATVVQHLGPPITYSLTFLTGWTLSYGPGVHVGGIVGAVEAFGVTLSVQTRTILTGRRARGGKHFGPLTESDTLLTSGGQITDATGAAWTTAMGNFFFPLTLPGGAVMRAVILSLVDAYANIGHSTTNQGKRIIDTGVNEYVGSQLSRKIKNP